MTDKDDIEREIEENEARVRDTEDIDIDEDVIRQRENDNDGTILNDLDNAILGRRKHSPEHEVEYHDNDKATRTEPE